MALTGSLAMMLALTATRRKGQDIHAGDFLKIGVQVVPLTHLSAVIALWLTFLVWPPSVPTAR